MIRKMKAMLSTLIAGTLILAGGGVSRLLMPMTPQLHNQQTMRSLSKAGIRQETRLYMIL